MRKKVTQSDFLETLMALVVFGIARAIGVVCSVLVVASVFGLVLSGWRLAKVPSAGWVDGLVVAISIAILACWLALGRGSLEDKSEAAAHRWCSRWLGDSEDEDSPEDEDCPASSEMPQTSQTDPSPR